MTYPDVDTEVSGYVAAICYDIAGAAQPLITLPGRHDTFDAARRRAQRIASAIIAAGDVGVSGWVTYGGERPAGLPRNGVRV